MNTIIPTTPKIALLLLTFTIFTLFSCEKGETGPQGAQGAQGPAGPEDPSGAANEVVYEFTPQSSNWYAGSGSPGLWTYTAVLPALTQGIIDTGAVFVYWTQSNIQTLMPFTLSGVDYMYITGFPVPGLPASLQVQITESGAYATTNPTALSPVTFKVIIDP